MKITGFVLENVKVFRSNRLETDSLSIGETIGEPSKEFTSLNCKELWVLPGLIDCHVHFRVPGAEHKENWITGSRSAAYGGVTTVLDMPNTNPPTTSVAALSQKREIASRDSCIRFGFHFGATPDNFEEVKKAQGIRSIKLYMGSSTGNLLVDQQADWEKWFKLCAQNDWVLVVHAESEHLIKKNTIQFSENSVKMHNKIRDSQVESQAIENALQLQKKFQTKLHIAHLSSKAGLELVANAKKESNLVSCEVCPHHLFLSEDDLGRLGNFGKMNPSLKTKEDVSALWKGVRTGVVDCIATDHAPHTLEEKNKPYTEAPSGVPGVETMLPLLLNAVCEEKIDLATVVKCCAQNPARIFGLQDRGELAIGKLGDAVLVDPKSKWVIKGKKLHSKCGWTPFENLNVTGKVVETFVGGKGVLNGQK